MKHALKLMAAAAAIAIAPSLSFAAGAMDHNLIGLWKSVNANERALNGVIELKADGAASLQPEGYPAMAGTWRTADGKLFMTMRPYGQGIMDYAVAGDRMELTYDNGAKQDFERASSRAPSNKESKK